MQEKLQQKTENEEACKERRTWCKLNESERGAKRGEQKVYIQQYYRRRKIDLEASEK